MVRNVYDDRIDGVLQRVFGEDDGPLYVADASASVVSAVVATRLRPRARRDSKRAFL